MIIISLLKGKLSLSANALKVIAIIAMTIDHLAWMGITQYAQALTPMWEEEKINILLKILITVIGCILTVTSDWSCTAPLSILMMGRKYNNYCKQMFWLITIVSLYAVAFDIFKDPTYGVVHMAGLFSILLLSLYNGQRGKLHWLGNFFYLYYPIHLTLIGIITHTFFS